MKYFIVSKNDTLNKKIKQNIINKLPYEYSSNEPDIVFTLGGDGTFLKAVHRFPNALFFGIHTGHLGFYSNYGSRDIEKLLNDIINKEYKEEKLPLLTCRVFSKEEATYYALNEATLICPPRTLILDVEINNEFLEEFRGTGICVSTPTGSTAYNKSLGGAILDHSLNAFQITEIAGINSTYYETLASPLILSQQNVVGLNAGSLYKSVYLTIDNSCINLVDFKRMEVKFAEKYIRIGTKKEIPFLDRVKRSFLQKNKRGNFTNKR